MEKIVSSFFTIYSNSKFTEIKRSDNIFFNNNYTNINVKKKGKGRMCMRFRSLAKNKDSLKFRCSGFKSESGKLFAEKYGTVFEIVPNEHTLCKSEKTGEFFEISILSQAFKNYTRID